MGALQRRPAEPGKERAVSHTEPTYFPFTRQGQHIYAALPLGSGSLYEADSAGAASFCMPLFSMTKAEMNIQQNCFCALLPPSMRLLMYLPEEGLSAQYNLEFALKNGGPIVSKIWQCNEHDLTKI